MKLFKKRVIIHQDELNESLAQAEKRGEARGSKTSKERIENLEKAVEKLKKEAVKAEEKYSDELEVRERTIANLNAKVEVLEEAADEVRDVVKQSIENEDAKAVLEATKESQDAREARLKAREAKIGDEEEGEYKRGYADGVADGVRKINEITAKDRENAMKVAMVAAASHTQPEVVKNALQLTAGDEDKETK